MNQQQHHHQCIKGVSASPGYAGGELFFIPSKKNISNRLTESSLENDRDLEAAVEKSVKELLAIMDTHSQDSQAQEIIEFQIEMLQDPELLNQVLDQITDHNPAMCAWQKVLDDEISDYKSSDDEYFRARATDLIDIRQRVIRHLTGASCITIPDNCVVVADDLTPSDFLSTRWGSGGIALTQGSVNSHVAMLARSRNIPMLVNLDARPQNEAAGSFAFLDAQAGELTWSIQPSRIGQYREKLLQQQALLENDQEFLLKTARLKDKSKVSVQINIADPSELASLNPQCCDGIGLVRTEFLFHDRARLPNENEQYSVYRELLEWANGIPVTVRTLDAGGDKPINGLTLEDEKNPFLGVRGLRLSLLNQAVFIEQIRALLRASVHGQLKVMLPMVTVPEEIGQVREIMAAQLENLCAGGHRASLPPLGIMVEVPAAAISIEQFNADFFSIGSNDLIQYVTAVSRDSHTLQYLAAPDTPAVAKLIRKVISHADKVSKEVSLCGEMAGDPDCIERLLGFGLRNFSVTPAALARTKRIIIESGA